MSSQSEFALIGQAIAEAIGAAFTGITATHRRRTTTELAAIRSDAWTVDVIQKSHATEPADRSSRHHSYTFDIVWRRRFALQADEATAIDPLCYDVEAAEDTLYDVNPTVNGNIAECVETKREPPYDPEALAKGVYLAVITGTWTIDR